MVYRTRLLLRFGVRFPDPFPESLQRVGAGLRTEPVIRAESLYDGLDHFFLKVIRTSFAFPVIEHFGKSTDNRAVAVSVLMFKAEKFS
jgi:hypothetical protein